MRLLGGMLSHYRDSWRIDTAPPRPLVHPWRCKAVVGPFPDGVGQLETIGDGYQHLNNKQLGRALIDYLQYGNDQVSASRPASKERSNS